jgi:16S rRNA (guanine(966)-N(2))-methyltransferase RsmD
MRVIGGSARGRTLKGPARSGTRPTSDLVRGVIFDLLASHDVEPDSVLDLYSGTGALGIEALSRGAERCDFVEADAKTCEVIRQNLALTRLLDRGKVYPMTVAKALSRLTGLYDLVVADPPYEYDRAEAELTDLIERGLLAPEGTLVVEHSKRHDWPEALGGRLQLLTRRHGDTKITIYQ